MSPLQPKECPCHSGKRYAECCKPLHEGGVPASPEALMRSRYSAFALGIGEYLLDTLAKDHGDRDIDRAEYIRSLSSYKNVLKYMGLAILHAEGDEVLFYARMFESGRDVSFAELSHFVNENGFWKYKDGVELHHANMPKDPEKLDRATFLALVEKQNEGVDLRDDV